MSSIVALRVTCGTGKTRTAEEFAVERAHAGQKTAITSPTHSIARDSACRIREAGVGVRYRSAPHRVLDRETGEPLCQLVPAAEAIAASGLSVQRELCHGLGSTPASPCPHREGCAALKGSDEDEGALVWIGPHALIEEAAAFVGDGLLIVDEPPPAVETSTVRPEDLDLAFDAAPNFRDAETIRLALHAVGYGLAEEDVIDLGSAMAAGISTALAERPQAATIALGGLPSNLSPAEKLVAALRRAIPNGVPRLSTFGLGAVRAGRALDASKTIGAIVRGLLEPSVRTKIDDERNVIVVELAGHLRAALLRAGSAVLIDATLDAEALMALCQFPIDVQDFEVADGAPIERVHVECSSANRRGWIVHGRPHLKNLVGPLRRALEIVAEDPTRRVIGIVTFMLLESALAAAWRGDGEPELVEVLSPWRARGGELRLLHHGATRGRNDFEDADAVITLGDPWPNRSACQAACEALRLDFYAAYERACKAELAQALGRVRTVWRKRPALAVHVGGVRPDGWAGARVEQLKTGRPSNIPVHVSGAVLAAWRQELLLSQVVAARLLGIPRSTLQLIEGRGASFSYSQTPSSLNT
jgi:hypothetical protein